MPVENLSVAPMMGDVPDIRKRIQARMKELDMSGYALAKAVEAKGVRAQTVYDYLAERSQMNGGHLGHVLDALGLDVLPRDEKPGRPRRPAPAGKRERKAR